MITHAKDVQCSEFKKIRGKRVQCTNQAVAFFPIVDPDIQSYPYCRECLDKAKMSLFIKLQEVWNN